MRKETDHDAEYYVPETQGDFNLLLAALSACLDRRGEKPAHVLATALPGLFHVIGLARGEASGEDRIFYLETWDGGIERPSDDLLQLEAESYGVRTYAPQRKEE